MKHNTRLVLLVLAAVLLLSSCTPPQGTDTTTRSGSSTTSSAPVEPLQTTPAADTSTSSATTTQPPATSGGSIAVDDRTWKIGSTFFAQNQLALDQIFVYDDETLLFFASRQNLDGTISEQSVVCVYSLSTDRFSTQMFELGTVAIYPETVHDDGTVSIVTMDSESYEFNGILFFNPGQMSAEQLPLPRRGDLVSLSVSPDRRYYALTTYTGVVVTDASLSTEYLSVGLHEDGGAQLIPAVTAWSKNSAYLSLRFSDTEDVYYPALADVMQGTVRFLTDLARQEAHLVGDRLFCHQWYPYLPCGFAQVDGTGFLPIPFEEPALASAEISQLAVSREGSFVAVTYLTQENEVPVSCDALIADAASGKTVRLLSFSDFDAGLYSFETIAFTPDQRTAIMTTSSTMTRPKEVYVLDFGR